MSRNQWIILGVLGLTVVLVFGCLGGFALTHLTGEPPTETPEPAQASDTATATFSATPTHSPGCVHQSVLEAHLQLERR